MPNRSNRRTEWLQGTESLDFLVDKLSDTDWRVRSDAARALERYRDRTTTDALVRALADPMPEVRVEAAATLGDLGDDRATSPLIQALGDNDADVVWNAAIALGKIGDQQAVHPLIRALERAIDGPDLGVKGALAEALGWLGSEEALPILERLSRYDHEEFFGGGATVADRSQAAIQSIRHGR